MPFYFSLDIDHSCTEYLHADLHALILYENEKRQLELFWNYYDYN